MSQDAYSPLTGHWGVEGIWDVLAVGLAITALALLLSALTRSRRERWMALVTALVVVPAYSGIQWLGGVQVEGPGDDGVDCLMSGPVDAGSACGATYLGRYAALMVPLTLVLVTLLCLVLLQVHGRIQRHRRGPTHE